MKNITGILRLVPILATAQSNYHFSHTENTLAPPDTIWKIWTDVSNWKQWDKGLKDASLSGSFGEGARGKLIPDKGPRTKFIVTKVDPGISYTFKSRVPLGWLVISRRLTSSSSETVFTHEVEFTGPLKKIFGASLGKRYQKMLPEVMNEIKRIAETRNNIVEK